jgi:cytidylate kinase
VLQHKPEAFHVFVYAPHKDRILRLRERLPRGTDIEQRVRSVDAERAKYLQEYFSKHWLNPHLYDLMISSHPDEASTVRVIQCAMATLE